MRKPSTKLFELIKSLSQTEKRYFKLFASMYGDSQNYMRLFKVIEGQQEYDENTIKEQFKGETFIKQLTVVKTYLYNLILKSLRNYHSEDNIDMLLKNWSQDIRILHEKGLQEHAEELTEKAISISRKYEKHVQLIELLSWQESIYATQVYENRSEEEIVKLFEDISETVKLLENTYHFRKISTRIYWKNHKSGRVRTDKELLPYTKLMASSLLKDKNNAISYPARISFYASWFIYYFLQNNYADAYIQLRNIISFMEKYPHQIEEQPKTYVSAHFNKASCEMQLRKINELLSTTTKIKSLDITSSNFIKQRIFYWGNSFELLAYVHLNEIEKGEKLIREINHTISIKKTKPANKLDEILLWTSMAYFYIVAMKFKSANKYLNYILTNKDIHAREHVYSKTLILQLIVHFETNKHDLLESSVKSIYRYLRKKDRLYKLEEVLLEFIRKKMIQFKSEKEMRKAFTELISQLKKVYENPWEKTALDDFDLIAWLESKVQKKPFGEVLKSKTYSPT